MPTFRILWLLRPTTGTSPNSILVTGTSGGQMISQKPASCYRPVCDHGMAPSKCDISLEHLTSRGGISKIRTMGPLGVLVTLSFSEFLLPSPTSFSARVCSHGLPTRLRCESDRNVFNLPGMLRRRRKKSNEVLRSTGSTTVGVEACICFLQKMERVIIQLCFCSLFSNKRLS